MPHDHCHIVYVCVCVHAVAASASVGAGSAGATQQLRCLGFFVDRDRQHQRFLLELRAAPGLRELNGSLTQGPKRSPYNLVVDDWCVDVLTFGPRGGTDVTLGRGYDKGPRLRPLAPPVGGAL